MQHEEHWKPSAEVEQEAFWNTITNTELSEDKLLKAACAYDKTMRRDESYDKFKHKIRASMDHS